LLDVLWQERGKNSSEVFRPLPKKLEEIEIDPTILRIAASLKR